MPFSKSPSYAPWPLRVLLAAAVLLPLGFFVTSAWLSYRSTFQSAEDRAQHLTRLLREHTSKVFETIRLVLQQTDERLRNVSPETLRTGRETWAEIKALQLSVEQVGAIFVIDKDGFVALTSRLFPAPPVSFADRDYFLEQQGTDRGTYVGRQFIGKISQAPIFNFSIRRSTPDGQFNGVIGVSALHSYFQDFYATMGIASDNFAISLIRDDGYFLVRYPSHPGEPVLRSNLVAQLKGSREVSFTTRSPVDHLERLYHVVRVPGFPVYVTYSIDRAAILAEWYRDLWFFGLISAGVGLVLFLASWMAMQRARQEAEAVRSLRQTSLSLAEEVSRRERAEASLLQWQRLEAVGQLTGGIAHDFNNLLTIILGNLQLADRRADIGGMRRLHDAMRQAAERGAGLTRQLLAFSRQQALNPEAVDLNSVLQNTRAWISRGIAEDVEIGFDLQSDLWAAQVDVGEFEAAILNIAVNARDAMPDGGQLTIRTRNLELTPDDAQHHPNLAPGPYVCVSLEDTGQGMPPDVLARVYEPFFTTKEVGKGTGLGLSRVYGFVQQSGGSIKVESQVGQGTTVSIYLPKSSAPATAIGEDASDKITASGTGTVLVVEDNEDLRRVTVSLLHDLGYSTMVARNGIEALAVLRAGEPVDLLFSDIVMPRGMTGVQLAREALALQPDLKVLLTTGFAGSLAEHDFPVLQKPFSELELSRAIGRAMLSEQTV